MNGNGKLIEALTSSAMFKDYERAFTEATGMPMTLRPVETWQLPLHGKRRENPFCSLVAERSRSCTECLRVQEKLAQSALNCPSMLNCAYGLTELAVPVKLGTETIGFLQTGQVLKQRPSEKAFDRAMSRAEELGVEFDKPRAREAFFKSSVVPASKLDSAAILLGVFADHLSMKSNQIAVQQANAEPPVITKAKRYIEERYAEDLSLGEVAAAVHTSLFYFCKLFRKATHVSFTEYVSRVRIEKAKNLLLNPNLRVSEIAYETGFQSLTHFNRVFKKLAGESPTKYRQRLPKAA